MNIDEFSWLIEGELAGMAWPGRGALELAELRARGIGALVSLTRRPLDKRCVRECGLDYLHLPIGDFRPPQPEQVRQFVDFCERNIAEGRAVGVHCLAGRGRTGTMLACYCVHRGASAEQAIDEVRRLRPGSIETFAQEAAVHRFAAHVREHGADGSIDSRC